MQSKTRKAIRAGAEGIASAVGRRVYKIAARAHDNVERVSDAAEPRVERLVSKAHAAIDEVAAAATRGMDTLEDEDLLAAPAEWLETAGGYVRAHPIASLAIVVAAGWALTRLSR